MIDFGSQFVAIGYDFKARVWTAMTGSCESGSLVTSRWISEQRRRETVLSCLFPCPRHIRSRTLAYRVAQVPFRMDLLSSGEPLRKYTGMPRGVSPKSSRLTLICNQLTIHSKMCFKNKVLGFAKFHYNDS